MSRPSLGHMLTGWGVVLGAFGLWALSGSRKEAHAEPLPEPEGGDPSRSAAWIPVADVIGGKDVINNDVLAEWLSSDTPHDGRPEYYVRTTKTWAFPHAPQPGYAPARDDVVVLPKEVL